MEKLHDYQGWTGRVHEIRDSLRTKYEEWKERRQSQQQSVTSVRDIFNLFQPNRPDIANDNPAMDYSHIYRRKTRWELIRISAAVMGIEFAYAAETAFVSPTLLKIGVQHQQMTLVWALSPLVGFFLTPVLGSMSDRCPLNIGRRRPFILLLSLGVFIGLLLVPNGETIGYSLGDYQPDDVLNATVASILPHRSTASEIVISESHTGHHPWGILFTILGTVMLDFDADACQSPSRAYLLDVTVPEDHAKGLSTFTIMAGLGGFMGYTLGAINWDATFVGEMFGGHVRAVFSLITILFVICVTVTVTSFAEIPLPLLEASNKAPDRQEQGTPTKDDASLERQARHEQKRHSAEVPTTALTANGSDGNYGAMANIEKRRFTMPAVPQLHQAAAERQAQETSFTATETNADDGPPPPPVVSVAVPVSEEPLSLGHYLRSIVFMPMSLRMLCLTNLFCWMAHVCYSLYFTDFVGEAVYMGDPKANEWDIRRINYEAGVRFGCWGMAMYSLSCACYSSVIERFIKRFGAKRVYVGGLLFDALGMALMAWTKHKVSVIVFSWTAGVMYATLFTLPYLLIATYHNQGVFEVTNEGEAKLGTELRGLGTDVALISSMVFLAQFILSICMGSIVSWSGTTTSVVSVAAVLSLCGAVSATQVMYLDL